MVSASQSLMAPEFPDVTVFASGVSVCNAERAARAVGGVLQRRGIAGGVRLRLTTLSGSRRPLVVQVNLRVRDTPARVQTLVAGIDDVAPALARLDRQIVRVRGPWRPRPWPDPTRRALTAPSEAVITRRKSVVLRRGTPLDAVAVMDAMDYDVSLFADVETGEDAVVYRAGPSGLRLARQRHMYPPGWSWSSSVVPPPVPLIVNSVPTPELSEAAAVDRVCEQGLRFLFFTDPATGRGQLLYVRHDSSLGLITPINDSTRAGAS